MNPTSIPARLAAFALALALTSGLLLGVEGLATSEPSPQLLAKVGPALKA